MLALDASSAWCSVALLHGGVLQGIEQRIGHGHARLLPLAGELLGQHGLRAADCDAFAFGAGPGAFTGLRIACGVAQGLGYATGRPVVPVDSLVAVALHARRLVEPCLPEAPVRPVAVALDARMEQVYFGLHVSGLNQAGPIEVGAPAGAADRLGRLAGLAGIPPGALLCAGDGFERHAAALAPLAAAARAVLPQARACAQAIALLAAGRLAEGGAFAAADAAPRYVRDKVALDVDEQRALRQARRGP